MRVDALHYELPPELIAQQPADEREQARLMGLPRGGGPAEHLRVADLPEQLPVGTVVVVNDTRVIPARLLGRRRETGGHVEVMLVRQIGRREVEVAPGDVRAVDVWSALGRANKPLRPGAEVDVPRRAHAEAEAGEPAPPDDVPLRVRLLQRAGDDGLFEVALWSPSRAPLELALRDCGRVPLPPYIKRDASAEDARRYQTVYARHEGAIAAPTAGLHLSDAVLERLHGRGCSVATVTLHVGLGTFQPVTVDDLDQHPMHAESFVVPEATAQAIAAARALGAPVLAVGTTSVRALESAPDLERPGHVVPASGETRLLVQPGHRWQVVDALLTNFHVPRSTLLALVCAFGGTDRVLAAYAEAVRERYRFYSYGDAMLLWRAP